ncbi:aspartate--tRNA ligase [Mycoplasma zalophidermidis]|uniref:Aspartate--tRNA ligase n=1 Tax=Mycoplasma zalophidermidis TaxID=398174 RepID=A0ABS6DS73_9MOLU|nr:aspartate--tRNA ligase [Mycoplasma zalophidermidis]MBU4690067.1 aspartate--tRNA ligase [Mycoplasma zalophidermidis]MBU4693863.1 aspartate--tRNA ligase [Mycoplasma zalophidermidis]MCR8966830.1 aspartate--tRNA ligase [Mycoplasma zalophidermidis]
MKTKYINNNDLGAKNIGQNVVLHGWVANKRRFGELTFIDLRDRSGIVQCVFNQDLNITKESIIEVSGKVVQRKSVNKELKTGEIEVVVESFNIFSESVEELPFAVRDDIDVKEDLRLKYRYLDLRRPKMQNNIIMKNNLMFAVREFMHKHNFIDIETPMLARSTPEGARDFLVPTREADKFWALPQSPQLFKQVLMISGFERYYQFARCFRDEDGRKDRQPEFTQLDIEASFMNVEDFQKYIEELFIHIFKQLGLNLKTPLVRVKYFDALRDYGTDKPDLRYGYKIEDINDFCSDTDFNIIKDAPSKRLLFVDTKISKKDFKSLSEVALKNKANILFYFVVEDGKIVHTNFANKVSESAYKLIESRQNTDGTYFIVANTYENASKALGAVRVELNEMFQYANPDEYHLSWITDWPMFEYDEENNSWQAAHHPFTQFDHELEELDKLPLEKVMAKSYDLVLNGFELGSGSARIFDKKTQEKMFSLIGMNEEQQQSKFGWFMNSFKFGVPPHCGIGLGIDRLVMILAHEKSIRDVIAFPKNAKAQDVFTQAPNTVDEKQLNELFIQVKNNNN